MQSPYRFTRSAVVSLCLVSTLAHVEAAVAESPPLAIDADFPGGNVVVEAIEDDAVRLHQHLRDTPRFWFYWCFRVRGAAGRTLDFAFTQGNVFGTRGPAVSLDGGGTWRWLGESAVQGDGFSFDFPTDAQDVRFCFAMPYVAANWREFLGDCVGRPGVKLATLGQTRKGRAVELLEISPPDGAADYQILVTCRHHACEMMANYALEGLIQMALGDTAQGRWLRRRARFCVVPFMDKDGVEEGDQGKTRTPHDHWVDYGSTSRYPSVDALRRRFEGGVGGPVHVALDLHCPYIRDSKVFFAVGRKAGNASNTDRLCQILECVQTGELVYRRRDNMAFGQGWNTSQTHGERGSFVLWAERLPENLLAATIEMPYATVGDAAVTPATARAFGKDLGVAVQTFLASLPGEEEKR